MWLKSWVFVHGMFLILGQSRASASPPGNPLSRFVNTRSFPAVNLTSADQVLRLNLPNSHLNGKVLKQDPTYFIVASDVLRPGHVYRVAVHLLDVSSQVTVRISIHTNGAEVLFTSKVCHAFVPELLGIEVPINLSPASYKLRVEGSIDGVLGGMAFYNETFLHFSDRSITVLIQTDRPFYKQGQTVFFRALPINTELKIFKNPIDIYMVDAKGVVVKRWMSRHNSQGPVSLTYELPQQPTFGTWTIRVVAYGQLEEEKFLVEEYYEPPFEVNVNLAPFLEETDDNVQGFVEANYTSGLPVKANLSIHLSVHPPRVGFSHAKTDPSIEEFIEEFNGIHYFKIPMWKLDTLATKLEGMQVTVAAKVGDVVTNKIMEGFSSTLIANGELKLRFLGTHPQVFKAGAPFKTFAVVSYHDNSPLPFHRLDRHKFELLPTIIYQDGYKQPLEARFVKMLSDQLGIWPIHIDLLSEPAVSEKRLKNIKYLKLEAKYRDNYGKSVRAELLVLNYFSPSNNHLSVSTSTKTPQVGEYIVFHVRADFYLLEFYYLIVSKGLILASGTESIVSSIRTFAITILSSMAPSTTIIVYYISLDGDIVADSLTFPVNGLSHNTFNLTLKNHKSSNSVELTVKGKPNSFVSLSAIPKELHVMQGINEMTRHFVLEQMSRFDNDRNISLLHRHVWLSRQGFQNREALFPAYSYAPDSNRTFTFSGLSVFTDANMTSINDKCDTEKDLQQCLSGGCYNIKQYCDGKRDCEDGSDETDCPVKNVFLLRPWRIYRHNHVRNNYENSWLWRVVNTGPRGRASLNLTLPERRENWMLSAFSLNEKIGLSVTDNPIEYLSEPAFYMTLEMPTKCKLGEQLGLRATVFNNQRVEIQVAVILASSTDYVFFSAFNNSETYRKIHNHRGHYSNEEHHHYITVKSRDSVASHIPILPLKLGDINVTVMAQTESEKLTLTRRLKVEPSGIPQHRHTSILLDMNNRAYLISYFDLNLSSTPLIPNRTERSYVYSSNVAQFSVFGDVVGPPFLSLPINGSVLLGQPNGCAEQNMFDFAINLYTLKYIRMTNQRDLAVEKKMFLYMNSLYAQQLSYLTHEGAFKQFRWKSKPSVWLTAFSARILQEANNKDWENYMRIDESLISRSVSWLLKFQTPYGAFIESSVYPFGDKLNISCCLQKDESNDPPRYRNVSLTAHVVLTLHSVRDLRGPIGTSATKAKNLATNYLERMLRVVQKYKDPYELAIVTYALTVVGSQVAEEAFDILGGKGREIDGMMYWGREKILPPKYNIESNKPYLQARLPSRFDASNIETTAYALMVFVAHRGLLLEPIVEWLNFGRLSAGGWISNQDTLVAYQALLEYSTQFSARESTDISIAVDSSSSPGFEKIFHVNKDNLGQLQSVQIPNAWGTVRLVVKGTGTAVAQLSLDYNVDSPEFQTQPPISSFSVVVHASYEGRNASRVRIRSCQRWIAVKESDISGIAVLELEIPTGYHVYQKELNNYITSGVVAKLKDAMIQERKVIMYFKHLDTKDTCVEVIAERILPVANLTKYLGVKVYDYYTPERFNESLFETVLLHELNICQVCGSYECKNCFAADSSAVINEIWKLLVFSSVALLFAFNV